MHGFTGPREATPHCLIDLSQVIVTPALVLHWTLSTFSTNEPGGRLEFVSLLELIFAVRVCRLCDGARKNCSCYQHY